MSQNIDFTTLNFGNYTTAEVDTGFTWIDTKTIYKQTFSITTLSSASEQTFNIGLNAATTRIIKVEGGVQNTAPDYYPIEYMNPGATTVQNMQLKLARVAVDQWQVRCNTGTSGTLIITIWFTK